MLDAFAGSGALGLEALSRGAGHVTFLEEQNAALTALQRNVAALGAEAETTVLRADVLHAGIVLALLTPFLALM